MDTPITTTTCKVGMGHIDEVKVSQEQVSCLGVYKAESKLYSVVFPVTSHGRRFPGVKHYKTISLGVWRVHGDYKDMISLIFPLYPWARTNPLFMNTTLQEAPSQNIFLCKVNMA